jgi:hypothetical protein
MSNQTDRRRNQLGLSVWISLAIEVSWRVIGHANQFFGPNYQAEVARQRPHVADVTVELRRHHPSRNESDHGYVQIYRLHHRPRDRAHWLREANRL